MKSIEQFLKRFFLQVIGILKSDRKTPPRELPINRFKRILIVRQHDQLGDLLISTPTIRAVRKRYPNAYIAVVVREYNAPLMWDNPNIDEIIVFHEKLKQWNFQVFRSFMDQLRRDGGFDIAIMLNTVSRSFSSDLIALLAKSKYIIGPNHLKLVPDLSEKIYNVLTPRSEKLQLEIDHNLDIVRSFGVHPDGYEYDLMLDNDEIHEAETIHHNMKIVSALTVGVHFGTLDISRRFPLPKLARLIDWIKSHDEIEVVVIIGPNEEKLRQELQRMVKSKVLFAPLMPLRVSAAFIKKMNLFICNDTGTLHIASAMRVPTVSFHSLNDPAAWKPPHERHIGVRAEDKKITSITVEQAISAVQTQIDRIKSVYYG